MTFTLNQLGTDEEVLGDVVEQLFALLLPQLAGALEGFPLPDFLGLQLTSVDVDRAGDFISLYLDLTPAL